MHSPEQRRRVRRTVWRLAQVVPLMFAFTWFVMLPLYDELRVFTLVFSVSPKLPREHHVLSVSYTFFKLEHPPEEKS